MAVVGRRNHCWGKCDLPTCKSMKEDGDRGEGCIGLAEILGCATVDELEVISSSGVMLSSSQYK